MTYVFGVYGKYTFLTVYVLLPVTIKPVGLPVAWAL